ncbi:protein-(glutamine-N5) methyltransferase, release factor-specific, partial [Escherichia coli]|nr:protein-(glutamine-N5) methyltransferase, release factor-specific [Escherichia coli]
FSALSGQQSLMIVSNPPYIEEQDPHRQQGEVRFEPLTALVASDRGMSDIVHIIEQTRKAAEYGGFLLLGHGGQQGEAVRQAFTLAGYHAVETCRD